MYPPWTEQEAAGQVLLFSFLFRSGFCGQIFDKTPKADKGWGRPRKKKFLFWPLQGKKERNWLLCPQIDSEWGPAWKKTFSTLLPPPVSFDRSIAFFLSLEAFALLSDNVPEENSCVKFFERNMKKALLKAAVEKEYEGGSSIPIPLHRINTISKKTIGERIAMIYLLWFIMWLSHRCSFCKRCSGCWTKISIPSTNHFCQCTPMKTGF